jgi:hypothetical protein
LFALPIDGDAARATDDDLTQLETIARGREAVAGCPVSAIIVDE